MKKLLTMAIFATMSMLAGAQTPIPLSQDVRHGELPNGLNYYILHNEEPKERVNFYIAQKVGSTLETQEQLGLAHFLEHMAFNGTTHYPGKNMLNYLQSKGIRFGADINAYTGFDETVYNIDNVPTTDKALVDSVLLVLHDWSGEILLEEDEINAERGVIQEEWRSRNNAQTRMFTAILPMLYQEYQYQQMPIGKMEVVMNFPPQAIREYYKKWYRPDQQGIVIVGDIDVNEMEAKVKDLFSKIPMPENAAKREYPSVSDNEKPIYAYFDDKEMPQSMIMVSFKSDKAPVEFNNTVEVYMQENVIEALIEKMINNRLNEYSKDPNCHYSYAGVSFGDYWISKTKASFDITIIAKDGMLDAYKDALAVVARACKTGFMQTEVVRSRDEILSNYEKMYNERNNTKSATLARKIIRTFIDNKPYPGQEAEYKMMQQVLPMIPVQALNEFAAQILTPNNQVIVVSRPKTDSMEMITEEIMTGALSNALDAQYEAYVDEVLPESLIADMPKAGTVKDTKATAFETTTMTLSNGVKVVVKPTDFKADEVTMTAYREGGRDTYTAKDANNVNMADEAFNLSKRGQYSSTTIDKYLAGKNVKLDYSIGNSLTSLGGESTVKDLEKLMELIYVAFTDIQPDMEAYQAQKAAYAGMLKNMENNPQFIFQQRLGAARACGNPLYNRVVDLAVLEGANYEQTLSLIKNSLANAADYTFIFTGNVTPEALKPMLEKYIATLPSKGKSVAPKVVSPVPNITGIVNDKFDIPMETPSTMVFVSIDDNNLKYNCENAVMINSIGDILANRFTDTLREEEGGTYSPHAFSSFNPWTNYWAVNYLFQTNSEMQEKLINRANEVMNELFTKGADAINFNKVKSAMQKQYEINVRTNKYWDGKLMDYIRGIDEITGHKEAIDNMTLEGLNKFMKTFYNGKNRLNFIMTGVPAKK